MKLLLDTHALLWSLTNPKKLPLEVRKEIISPQNLVLVSVSSLWELQIKESIGKLKLSSHFLDAIEVSGFEILQIHLEHLKTLKRLPLIHRDPFDRMLIAQAQSDDLTLVTCDHEMLKYEVSSMKC
ncbi:MAG: type II toxin-antitoxin system VapC family toxin [Deltaproteobacteria bacterium]|nr:type II toxin-antitoxin system VapC family toxin [Deltaproteobacteria bacterium]